MIIMMCCCGMMGVWCVAVRCSKKKKKRLTKIAKTAHEFINSNSDTEVGLNPEIVNVIYYRNCV